MNMDEAGSWDRVGMEDREEQERMDAKRQDYASITCRIFANGTNVYQAIGIVVEVNRTKMVVCIERERMRRE
jgi:hypothetical protein